MAVARGPVASAVDAVIEDVGCAVGAVVDVSVRASEFQILDEGAMGSESWMALKTPLLAVKRLPSSES